MSNHPQLYVSKAAKYIGGLLIRRPLRYWRRGWRQKVVGCTVVLAMLCLLGMYSIAVWYQRSVKSQPLTQGVSFIADYASYLGTDPHQALAAILDDLHVKHLRLVSYWSDVEPTQGQYDFSELDYEMQQVQTHDAKVTLAVGLRQPRWPECHPPSWIDARQPESNWEPQLDAYITAVVQRYQHNPALQSYQLENEYFNTFGQCPNHDPARLDRELALLKTLDPNHPVIITRSNNYIGFSVSKPLPDIVGISVYRHVWTTTVFHRYFTYPYPSWYYAFLAGAEQILTGKPSVIHELQAEPWPPNGQDITQTSLSEQNQTLDVGKLKATAKFAQQTGIRQIDYWGAEYWYYRKTVLHDPSTWDEAKQIFAVR